MLIARRFDALRLAIIATVAVFVLTRPIADASVVINGNGNVMNGGTPSTQQAPGTPAYNPTWYAAGTIFIDPQNVSTTASDTNNGVTSSTALLTYREATRRWGSIAPNLGVTTTVTFLSSHTDDSDPVLWHPIMSNGAVATIQGAAPAATAAVFTLNGAKSRTVGSNAFLSGSFSAGAPAAGVLVTNTTAGKSSRAWVHRLSSGIIWNLTQPLAPLVPPSASQAPAEVDTWASTDTVTLSSPIAVNLVSFSQVPTDANATSNATNLGWIYNLTDFDPLGLGVDPVFIGGAVQVQECVFQRGVSFENLQSTIAGSAYPHDPALVNSYYLGGLFASATMDQTSVVGGGTNNFTSSFGSVLFDGDYVAGGFGFNFLDGGLFHLGFVYMDANMQAHGASEVSFTTEVYGGHVLYGTTGKTLNFAGPSRGTMSGTFTNGWTQATIVGTGVQLNGASTGHSVFTAAHVDTDCGAIATTVANLDAASSATCASSGFGGTAFNPGGASVSNLP